MYALDSKNVLSIFFETDPQLNSLMLKSEILQSFLYCWEKYVQFSWVLQLWKACAARPKFCLCVCKMCNSGLLDHKYFCGCHGFIEDNLWKVQTNYLVLCIPQTTIFLKVNLQVKSYAKKCKKEDHCHIKQNNDKFHMWNFKWQFTQLSHWIKHLIKTWKNVQYFTEQHRGQLPSCKGWSLAQIHRIEGIIFRANLWLHWLNC